MLGLLDTLLMVEIIMAGTYKNYMKLLASWPLDKSKAGRDLGQHIRDQLKVAFAKGEVNDQLDREICDRYYLSLKRICSNHYGQKFVRNSTSTASGLTREQCNLALSPEMSEYFAEEEHGLFKRIYSKLIDYCNFIKVKT